MEDKSTHTRQTVETMRAARQNAYGHARDVVEVAQAPLPANEPDQVLVRVAASSTNALDYHYLSGTPYFIRLQAGLRKPKGRIPGADIAGTVVAVGTEVTAFQPGDEVFGEIGSGGFAEYATAEPSVLAQCPSNLPLEESAALGVAALTALQGLRDWAGIRPGDRVLINGASGGVGTFAIQIAKALGASHVTAVCSTRNVDQARELGADRVVDYTTKDFTSIDDKFDIFFDNAGSKTLSRSRNLLTESGVLVMITGKKGRWIRPVDRMLAGIIRSKFWSQRFVNRTARASGEDGKILASMVEAGKVRPAIDRRFTLEEAVEALAYQSEGHARGKTLVVVD